MDARVLAEMTEHLLDLAEEHGVSVIWTRKGWKHAEAYVDTTASGEAFPKRGGIVIIPVVKTPADYLIGLHELGHVLDENSTRFVYARDQYEEILTESAAWAWAAEHLPQRFLRHIRAKDWNRAAYAWRTYVAGPAWRRSRPRLLPKSPRTTT